MTQKISRLVIRKELTEIMEELRNMTIEYGIEHGLNLYYGADNIIFPGPVCAGDKCGLIMRVSPPLFGFVFGAIHTHPVKKNLTDCVAKKQISDKEMKEAIDNNQSLPGIGDLLTSIEDLFTRGGITDSAVLTLSDVDIKDEVSVYIPGRLSPIGSFRSAIDRITNSPELEYKTICGITLSPRDEDVYNYVYDLFYDFKFKVPSDRDIIIERDNTTWEYRLGK